MRVDSNGRPIMGEPLSEGEIGERWGFHRATIEGPEATQPKHVMLRRAYIAFVTDLNRVLPPGRYASLVWTAMEEASMWAHKAIAQQAPVEALPEDHDDGTMNLVFAALVDSGLSGEQARASITEMQNNGILFREFIQKG